MLFWVKMEEKCLKWTICNAELEKQEKKGEFSVAI